jgi:CheY-like chemotaxis protein
MTRSNDPLSDPTVADTPAEHAGLRRKRLLYIEDNPVNAITVQELVQNHTRLDIVIEENGTNGVERARQMLPDLILIDMQLPDFDGLEVLRRLKSNPLTASLTCIALSANAVPQYIAEALAAGFDDYWTKPIEFDEFLLSLERLFPDAVHHHPLQ